MNEENDRENNEQYGENLNNNMVKKWQNDKKRQNGKK